MGYESKLYIVRKSASINENGKVFAEKIAEFNLCKFYPISDILRKSPPTNCYIYADDGNTQILQDRYGAPLTETTIADTIKVLKNYFEHGGDYWRAEPVLSYLIEVEKVFQGYPNVVILHFGY